MTVSKTWVVLVLFASLGLLVSACARQAAAPNARGMDKLVPATIFIYGADATNCTAKVAPYTIQPKRNEFAYWTIVDTCGVTGNYSKEVEVEFPPSSKKCGTSSSPIEGGVASAKGTRFIKAKIDNKCSDGDVFSYVVKVSGTALTDPELEIGQ